LTEPSTLPCPFILRAHLNSPQCSASNLNGLTVFNNACAQLYMQNVYAFENAFSANLGTNQRADESSIEKRMM
jgi:hypothetical protein